MKGGAKTKDAAIALYLALCVSLGIKARSCRGSAVRLQIWRQYKSIEHNTLNMLPPAGSQCSQSVTALLLCRRSYNSTMRTQANAALCKLDLYTMSREVDQLGRPIDENHPIPQTIDAHTLTYVTQEEQKGVKFDYRNIKLNTVSREENGVIPKSVCTQAYFVLQLYLLSRPLAPNFLFEASECRFINEFSTVGFRFRPYIVDCFAIVHLTCRKMFETFPFLHVHYCPVLFLSMSKLFLQLGRLSVLYHLIGYLKFLLSKIAWQL